jgi:hypothetical protein
VRRNALADKNYFYFWWGMPGTQDLFGQVVAALDKGPTS